MLDKDIFKAVSPYLLVICAWAFIGYVQEDAMIYARIIENSTLFNWRYNYGIDYASTTSIAWFLIAKSLHGLLDLSGESILRLISLFFALLTLKKLQYLLDYKFQLLITGSYAFLISSVYGMETILVIFYIVCVLALPKTKFRSFTSQSTVFLLALLIRPDLIIFAATYTFFMSLDDRPALAKLFSSVILSILIYCIICLVIFQEPLPPSVLAKFSSYSSSSTIVEKLKYFINFPIFLPEVSVFFGIISIIVNLIFGVCIYYYLADVDMSTSRKFAIISVTVYLLCFGVINFFPWYILPSALMIQILLSQYQPTRKIIMGLMLLTMPLNIWKLKASEYKEEYRVYIGSEIRRLHSAMSPLLLEPAGYIPYHAKVVSYDTIGLASPKVHIYRSGGQVRWSDFIVGENIGMVLIRDDLGFTSKSDLQSIGFSQCQSFNWDAYKSSVSRFQQAVLTQSMDYNYSLFCKEG